MTRPTHVPFAVLIACALAVPAVVHAQTEETPPAHVSYTDGRVVLEYEATSEDIEANTPLRPGDRLRTELGRAEVVFGDGSIVHLDEHTSIDLLSDRLVRLLAGRLAVTVGTGLAGQLQIDAASGSVRPLSAGEYRLSLLPQGGGADLELAVVRGSAELFTDGDVRRLGAGQRALADVHGALAGPWPFNSASFDAFERWSLDRLDARRGRTSYGYVPSEVRHYAGDFDRYGYWGHEPAYGYVWYPRVAYGWRPYYHGRWKHYPRWGWVWVGGPRWAWPTHHYGRWGVSSGGSWFWIPGRQWSGAWVHWGVASNYVSWCPLGFDNRPVFGFWSRGHRYRHDPWSGWTVIHRSHFGGRRAVHALALDGQRVVSTQGATFVTQGAAPAFRAGDARTRVATRDGGSLGLAVPRTGGVGVARVSPTVRQRSGRSGSTGDAGDHVQGATGDRRGAGSGFAIRRGSGISSTTRTGEPSTDAFGRRRGVEGSEAPRSPAATEPDLGAFRRRSGRGGSVTMPAPWRAEDVPVYRGTPPDASQTPGYGRPTAVPRSQGSEGTSGPSDSSSSATGSRGYRGGYAVPRGRSGSDSESSGYSSPRSTPGSSGGSYGAPSGRSSSGNGGTPSSGDGGGRVRRAPSGSDGGGSGGTAVERGSSSGGSGQSSGGRAAGRRR